MDWEDCFKPWVLERGREYFEKGAVGALERKPGQCSAVVSGTKDYKVCIEFDEDGLEDMSCTCPYAEKGQSCKHMAAVLYAMDAEEILDAAGALVMSIPEGELRALVREYCARDKAFMLFLSGKVEAPRTKERPSVKDSPLEEYDRLMESLEVEDFHASLEKLSLLVEGTDEVTQKVLAIRLSDWMETHQDFIGIREVEETVFRVLTETKPPQAERLLEYVDGRLLDPAPEREAMYVSQKLRLFKLLGVESAFVSPFRLEHLDVPEARLEEALYMINIGDMGKARALLEDGIASLPGDDRFSAEFKTVLSSITG